MDKTQRFLLSKYSKTHPAMYSPSSHAVLQFRHVISFVLFP